MCDMELALPLRARVKAVCITRKQLSRPALKSSVCGMSDVSTPDRVVPLKFFNLRGWKC